MKTSAVLYCAALCAAAWTCAPAGASEPASEIRVVYPASATSCEPILADGVKGLSAKPPVKENGRLEIETPLGQIREVRDTLAAIRQTQTELARGIETLVSRAPAPDRADEILAAIERASATRAEREPQAQPPAPEPEPTPAPTLSADPIPAPRPSEPRAAARIDAGTWRAVFAALAVWLALAVLVKCAAKARTAAREFMRSLASGRADAEPKGDAE